MQVLPQNVAVLTCLF